MGRTDIQCILEQSVFISPRSAEKHLYNTFQKAGTKNRLQLFNLLRADAM